MSIEPVVLAAYVGCLVWLFGYSLGQFHLVVLRRRAASRNAAPTPAEPLPAEPPSAESAPPGVDLPRVTVQLPVYNERYVVTRLLGAVAALDYPRERLEVQVLDDSTDDTSAVVAGLVPRLRAGGLDVRHIRRERRVGFKAGALAEGLERSSGEFVAVFDADFVPPAGFLRAVVPCFADPGVGAVQARWAHLNEDESLLTRVEGFLLDLHFGLEQPARSDAGLFLNFNGTAGVWRRTAIVDAGGWSARTVTEDIDLSYRAQLRGWRLVYLDDVRCPAELPADMSGVRSQQHRWITGGAQNARLHLAPVLRRRDLPHPVRHHAAQHLIAGLTYAVILLMLALTVPLAAVKGTTISVEYRDYGAPFVLATVALVATFHDARRPAGWRGHLGFAGLMLAFLVFTMGLAVHNGSAALAGLLGRGGTEFVRTPKAGSRAWTGSRYARARVDRRILRELAMMAWLAGGVAIGLLRHETAFLPVQFLGLAGLAWVIGLSLWHPIRVRRCAARDPVPDGGPLRPTLHPAPTIPEVAS